MTANARTVVLGPGEGTEFRIGADHVRTKGAGAQRSDLFSVVEYIGAAGQPGPPPHIHRSFEEAWFILEGQVTFVSDGRGIAAGPGTYLYVPRGTVHTFHVDGSRPARWIGIFSPGKYVGLLEELSEVMRMNAAPEMTAVARLFAKYDTELAPVTG